MRLRATTTIVLLILLICGCIADQRSGQCFHPQSLCFHNESASDSLSRLTNPALGADPPFPPPPPPPNFDGNDAIWDKAVCRGRNILKAMLLDEEDSSEMLKWPYTQSPWDGELVAELAEWGYSERKYTDSECDFSNHYFFGKALEELNIDPKPADLGGPTQCFHLRHYNGPTVERDQDGDLPPIREQTYKVNQKTYRSTGAFSRMGVNGRDGIIYFIHRMSPESAQQSWSKDDLPKLRSTSDLAWGLWNRVAKPDNLKNIRYFVSTNVVNPDTAYDIVPRALREKGVQSGHAQQWPGTAFKFGDDGEADLESSLALLGSPNGLAAGYFLLQHKKQLGGSKNFWKVVIFKDDRSTSNDINLLFYVDPNPGPLSSEEQSADQETKGRAGSANGTFESSIVKRSIDRKSFVREHIFRAKL